MNTTNKPIFDVDFFNDIISEDNTDFKNELIDIFVSSTAEQLSEIETVVKRDDFNQEEWHDVLHSLKGSCSSIGAMKIAEFIAMHQDYESISEEERVNIYSEINLLLKEATTAILKLKDK